MRSRGVKTSPGRAGAQRCAAFKTGVRILQPELTVTFGGLKAFIHDALTKLDLPDSDAMTVAALIAEADLQGSDGHGVSRLPQYARQR